MGDLFEHVDPDGEVRFHWPPNTAEAVALWERVEDAFTEDELWVIRDMFPYWETEHSTVTSVYNTEHPELGWQDIPAAPDTPEGLDDPPAGP